LLNYVLRAFHVSLKWDVWCDKFQEIFGLKIHGRLLVICDGRFPSRWNNKLCTAWNRRMNLQKVKLFCKQ
jgi:hypothetical protein